MKDLETFKNTILIADEETFYRLLTEFVERYQAANKKEKIWLTKDETLALLGVSASTLAKLRKEQAVIFSKIASKNILYNRESLLNYIKKNSYETYT